MIIRRVIDGYAGGLRGIGLFLALIAVAVVVSAVVVFPLWYAAVHWTRGFTWGMLSVLAAGAITFLMVKVVRISREAGTDWGRGVVLILIRLSLVAVFGCLLYGIVWLFDHRLFIAAVPALLLFITLFGIVRYARWGK